MSIALAERLSRIQPSATLAVKQRAAALKAQGKDVISFGVGEPDFDTPEAVREAAKQAIDKGVGSYTRVRGIDPLCQAIVDRSAARRGGERHSIDEVVVSVGAKHTLYNLAMVLFDPGDEVLIPAPHWVSYPAQCLLAEAVPVTVDTREADGFRLRPEDLDAAITDKTKALILCSPSNPTGSAYSADQLRELAEVIERRPGFWVIVDEIYGELTYDGFSATSLLEVAPQLRERIIVVDGVSKTYAMTGWRIGWALAPGPVAKTIEKLQGQSTTNPTAVAQYAALAALTMDQAPVGVMRDEFAKRRRVVVDGLNAIPGVSCREPEGAFYAFPSIASRIGRSAGGTKLEDDVAFAMYLLDHAGCALVPGSAFGAPGYLRMSYATSMDSIERGLARIADAIALLR